MNWWVGVVLVLWWSSVIWLLLRLKKCARHSVADTLDTGEHNKSKE